MTKSRKILTFLFSILLISIQFVFVACKDDDKTEITPKLEIAYTDIHLLENSYIDIKLIIEPEKSKNEDIIINLPQSNCIKSATIEKVEEQRYLRITALDYIENESEILNGAYIYLKKYDSAETKKSFNITVHKTALLLTVPQNVTYDENSGTIEWQKVDKARHYEVSINDEICSTSLTSLVLNETYYGKKLDVKVRAVYDLVNKFPAFVDSNYSETMSFMVLKKPQNLRHENGIIYWDKVEGASSYTLICSTPSALSGRLNEKEFSITATSHETQSFSSYDFASSMTYTFRVRAKGNNTSNYTIYSAQDSDSIKVKKLTAPKNLKFSQGMLSWDNVKESNGYLINIEKFNQITNEYEDFKTYNAKVNTYEFDNFDGSVDFGQYKFSIKTMGNNIETLAGDDFQSIVTTKLDSVKNLKILNGEVSWDNVNMASSYTIYLNSTPTNLISNAQEFNKYFMGSNCVAGEYEIQVVACGDGTITYNSNKCQKIVATKLPSTNLTLYENTFSWTKVNEATNYLLIYNNQKITIGNETSYLVPENLSAGNYEAKIMATCEGKISSEYSNTLTFTKMETPTNIMVKNGVLCWDKVENGTSYKLELTFYNLPQDSTESSSTTLTTVNNYYDFKGKLSGIYDIKISAKGGVNTINSIGGNIQIEKLATPSAPKVFNGKLDFEEIESGNLMVKIKETNQEMTASNFAPTDAKILTICYYAKGNNGENGKNYISSGDSAYLTTHIVKDLITPTIKNGNLIYVFPEGVTGIKIDFYKSGSYQSIYQILKYKDTFSTEEDFSGIISMQCYDNEDLGVGLYNLKISPQFSASSIESTNNGNLAYLYGGEEMNLSFCQLDCPNEIGSYYLNQQGNDAINQSVDNEEFEYVIKSSNSNKYAGYLYWTKISGATAYLIKINNDENNTKVIYPSSLITTNDGKCLYRLDGDFNTNTSGYNFAVKALGNESSYLSGKFSQTTSVSKIKLNSVGEIKVKDGDLTWNSIDGAFYEINYNGNLSYTYKNSFGLPNNSSSGIYNISVRALPKSEYYYASEYTSLDKVIKINAPIKYYISGGQIQWSNVNYASRYVLDINGYQKECEPQQTSLDLQNLIDTEDYFEAKKGNFEIKFKVIGTEDSDKSQSEYAYLSSSPISVSTTIMTSPDNIYVENGILTWTPIVGATKYALNLYHSTDAENTKTVYISASSDIDKLGNKFSLDNSYRSGLYYFSVMAIGDGSTYLNSQYSNQYSAQKLSNVENIKISDGKLIFDQKAGATSYNAKINVYGNTTEYIENFSSNLFDLGDNYSYGRYQIKFQAVGNTTSQDKSNELCYLSSDYCNIVNGYSEVTGNTVNYVYKLEPSQSMYVANDAVNWDRVKDAEGYNIKIDQTTILLGDESSLNLNSGNINGNYYQFSSGTYKVNVQAYGGTHFLSSSYRDNNLTAVKLDKVIGLGVEDGVLSWNTVRNIPDNLALYINGEYETSLRESFFNNFDENIGGVKGNKTYYVLGEDYEAGEYSISFVNSGGGETGYLSSDACEAVAVSKIESPTNVSIDSSQNSIVWQMQQLEDTSIKYKINLYKYETDELVQSFETLNSLSLVIESLEVGKYYVRIGTIVKSSDKKLLNSNISDKLLVTMPATPIGLMIENGKISWNKIEGVSGYNIEFSFYEGLSVGLNGNETIFRITLNGEDSTSLSIKDFSDDESFVCLLGNNVHSNTTSLGKYKAKINAFISNSLQSSYTSYVGDNSSKGVNGYYLFDKFSDGKGTTASPYRITNIEQLQNITYLPDLSYIQSADIFTNGIAFKPIGSQNNKFVGQYDGNGKTIDNLVVSITNPETELYAGLFGYIGNGGIVKNVILDKVSTSQGYYLGGICGYNEGIIYNAKVKYGLLESKTKTLLTSQNPIYIGGICGYNAINAIIDTCTYIGNVTTLDTISTYISYSGGICGYNYGTICQSETNKYNDQDKIVGTFAGGICGYNINTIPYTEDTNVQPLGSIYKCTNKINVVCYSLKSTTSIPGYAGGIVGMNIQKTDDNTGKCVNNNYSICYSNSIANVICNPNGTGLIPFAGGIAGFAGNGMYSCYTIGEVYGSINGVVTIDIGSSSALVNVGRLVGYKGNNTFTIDYCYYNILSDETLNSVGAESRASKRNSLVVGDNCMAISLENFKTENMATMLNAGLIILSHSPVWTNSINEYPTFSKIERVFD